MKKSSWIILAVFVAVAIGVVPLSFVMNKSMAESDAKREAIERQASDFDACNAAQHFVKNKLSSPASAEFPPCEEPDTITVADGDTWTVRSWVDADNKFGAMLRADTAVTMTYDLESEIFTLVGFHIDTR